MQVLHFVVGTVLCCAVLCCAVLCCAVLCCAVLCCAVLFCAVLHCICARSWKTSSFWLCQVTCSAACRSTESVVRVLVERLVEKKKLAPARQAMCRISVSAQLDCLVCTFAACHCHIYFRQYPTAQCVHERTTILQHTFVSTGLSHNAAVNKAARPLLLACPNTWLSLLAASQQHMHASAHACFSSIVALLQTSLLQTVFV